MSFVCTLNKNPIKDIISRLEGDTRFRNPVHHVQTRDFKQKKKALFLPLRSTVVFQKPPGCLPLQVSTKKMGYKEERKDG
jgi:hypothetical protein